MSLKKRRNEGTLVSSFLPFAFLFGFDPKDLAVSTQSEFLGVQFCPQAGSGHLGSFPSLVTFGKLTSFSTPPPNQLTCCHCVSKARRQSQRPHVCVCVEAESVVIDGVKCAVNVTETIWFLVLKGIRDERPVVRRTKKWTNFWEESSETASGLFAVLSCRSALAWAASPLV